MGAREPAAAPPCPLPAVDHRCGQTLAACKGRESACSARQRMHNRCNVRQAPAAPARPHHGESVACRQPWSAVQRVVHHRQRRHLQPRVAALLQAPGRQAGRRRRRGGYGALQCRLPQARQPDRADQSSCCHDQGSSSQRTTSSAHCGPTRRDRLSVQLPGCHEG